MNALVQTNTKNYMNHVTASHGLYQCGCFVESKEYLPGDTIEVDNESVYYGTVGFYTHIMEQLGYTQRHIGHVPEDLYAFAGRNIETVPLSVALTKKKTEDIFFKPIPENHKKFTGSTFNKSIDLINLYSYDENDLVLMSPVINIISEWRGFVLNDELVDSRNYKGNFRIVPDYAKIEPYFKLWKERPCAWSCDFGVTDTGETVIIECNDVISLGWYGTDPSNAGRLLIARWEEIHQNKSS